MKSFIPLIFIFLFPGVSYAQFQVGQDLVGRSYTDMLGLSVSLSSDGNWMALGGPFAMDSLGAKGAARIYKWADTAWVQVGQSIWGDTNGSHFGWSVALSGDGQRAAVGAIFGKDSLDNTRGLVKVIEWNGGSWQMLGEVLLGDSVSDYFGSALSMSEDGNRLAIAAEFHGSQAIWGGQVKVFDWNGTDWVQVGSDFVGTTNYGSLGNSISLSKDGQRLAIAAYNEDNPQRSNVGRVRIYEWQGNNWTLMGNPIIGQNAFDFLGKSVSLSEDGSILAVSAATNTWFSLFNGLVYVYQWNGTSWMQMGSNIGGPPTLTHFGHSVSISGDGQLIGIGAMNGYGIGESFLQKWNGNDWQSVGVRLPGQNYHDSTGYAVALSKDGSRFAVGSPNDMSVGFGIGRGKAKVYGLRPYLQEGIIRRDLNDNCVADGNETPLKEAWVRFSKDGSLLEYQVEEDGYYGVFLDTGEYQIFKGDQTYPYGFFCPDTQTLHIDTSMSSLNPLNLPVKDSILCPLIEVNIEQEFQYYCYPGRYWVSYKNTGARDAYRTEIEVKLPEPHLFTGSSIPLDSSSGQVFFFVIDTIRVGEGGSFTIDILDNCQYRQGNSFCAEVYARPDSLCLSSLPNIRIERECLTNRDLRFTITNLGDSVPEPLVARVFYGGTPDQTDTLQLIPHQPEIIDYSIRFSTPHKYQLVLAPYNSKYYTVTPITPCSSSAWLCCVTFEPRYPQGYQDAVCRRSPQRSNIWSSMEVSPQGTGPQHLTDPDSALTYTIRFFNKGGDTINHIEIVDTLSLHLDTSSLLMDSASHPFVLSYLPNTPDGRAVIKFAADSLQVPPSSVDHANSEGFVSFKVSFQPNLPTGTLVTNYAHASFDGGSPRITNGVYNQLFVCSTASGIHEVTSCFSYTWINGQQYFSSTNQPTYMLTSSRGCDSVVTLNLTIVHIDSTIQQEGDTLWVAEPGGNYQWFECSIGLEPILGATAQSFVPPENGNYMVKVGLDGCVVNSECVSFNSLSVSKHPQQVHVYPNPTQGKLIVELEESRMGIHAQLFNLLGEMVQEKEMGHGKYFEWKLEQAQGIYLLKLKSEGGLDHEQKVLVQ